MTKPIVPKGQEIQNVLERITDLWNEGDRFRAEQEIREIIAQELERKAIGNAETRIQMGMYVEDKALPNPIDWFRAAANTVRGHLPVTEQQWVNQAVRMAGWMEERASED